MNAVGGILGGTDRLTVTDCDCLDWVCIVLYCTLSIMMYLGLVGGVFKLIFLGIEFWGYRIRK